MSSQCQHCGAHVTEQFCRVFGDEDNVAHRCLACDSKYRVHRGSAAGKELPYPDPQNQPNRNHGHQASDIPQSDESNLIPDGGYKTEGVSDQGRVIVSSVDGYDISRHAVRPWRTRSSDPTPLSIEQAWQRSIPVGCDSIAAQVRLYPPEQLLFIYRDQRVESALPVGDRSLNTSHLKCCQHCDLLWDPAKTDACLWCDDQEESNNQSWIAVTGKPTGGESA